MTRKHWLARFLVVWAITLGALVFIDLALALISTCRSASSCSLESSSTREALLSFRHWVDGNTSFLTALGSLIVAVFTVVLGFATWMLWRSTHELVRGAEKNAERQLRAYLSVTPTTLKGVGVGQIPSADFVVKNCGLTPAYHYRYGAALVMLPHPLPDNQGNLLKLVDEGVAPNLTLHSSEDRTGEALASAPLTAEDVADIKTGDGRQLYVAGIVWYQDAFGIARHTKFCAFVDGPAIAKAIDASSKGVSRGAMDWIFSHVHNDAT